MSAGPIARKVAVKGIIQGVGFRPFVYQLAHRHHLKGDVANTSAGVTIHVEGAKDDIDAFREDLCQESPALAQITEIILCKESPRNLNEFTISASRASERMGTLISPDVSVCDDCLRELLNPDDRRYRYPFINCTHCGPRYTIIDDIPYDRPNTSMKQFVMCPACRSEYSDPPNRRFHAQANACAECGPHVTLYDIHRQEVLATDPIEKAADLIKLGSIVAIKGLGGFHLVVDAENDRAVRVLRQRKRREGKPLALMSYSIDHIRSYASVDSHEETLLKSYRRPIVLVVKKEPNPISKHVSPQNRYFGTMLPYTPLHYLLLSHDRPTLVMTSGNLSEEPIAVGNTDAFERLGDIADYFLVHDRDILLQNDDSIVKRAGGANRFIRRSRGYAPAPIPLVGKVPPILACGAELKNTICLTRNDQAFLSQHIGNLSNAAAFDCFRQTIDHMKRILKIQPEIIAFDSHPDYLSSRYALEQTTMQPIRVQHHHAHIAGVMGEHHIVGPVIGLALDGTGYGTDGAIWGGEILLADAEVFDRISHFEYVPMPGGAAAIREPWRMAISYLHAAFGEDFRELDLPIFDAIPGNKIEMVADMITKGINSPSTSSVGRLFDGIAAIVGIRYSAAFEGQAAMALEMLADKANPTIYDHEWSIDRGHTISSLPLIRSVVRDVIRGVSPSTISRDFHHTLVHLFVRLCADIRKTRGLKRVVLSGGVFQNSLLLTGLIRGLEREGFSVFTPIQIPANDGCISLGQAVIAAAVAGK